MDAMNIDDFIFAEEGAASVHDSSPQPPPASSHAGPQTAAVKNSKSSKALASAIPIKGRKGSSANQFVAQSVPVPPHHQRGPNDEFHYVPRHDRKTSIDDRRVSQFSHLNKPAPGAPPPIPPIPFILVWLFFLFSLGMHACSGSRIGNFWPFSPFVLFLSLFPTCYLPIKWLLCSRRVRKTRAYYLCLTCA